MMSNNRDYKTHARKVTTNLASHAELMAKYVMIGKTRESASRLALAEMNGRVPACAACGMTVGAVMFREYEAGTEWQDGTCCA